MDLFWIAAATMAGAVALVLAAALWRGPVRAGGRDADVYRDQLAEIAREAGRGVVPPEEAERLRAEVARRLIAAEGRAGAVAGRGPVIPAAVLAVGLVLGGGVWGYLRLGAPGYPDLPLAARLEMAEAMRAARPAQAEAEAAAPPAAAPEVPPDMAALMDRLRSAVAQRPDDLTGHRLLAEYEGRLGNAAAARVAQGRVVDLQGGAAPATDWVTLARLMVAAAGGLVTPEAEAALVEALRRDEADPDALFFLGLARMQAGRPDLGFRAWARYLEVAPPDSPWQAEVRARIGELARIAGVLRFTPPAPLPGPDAAAVAAAGAMSEADRSAMVRGMVEQLGARLASEGGSAAEWARMVRALGVLNETERARAVLAEARGTFAASPADLALIEGAARDAGVAE